MSTPLKVVFAGTPDFAARHLQGLIDSPHQIVAVMTQPDRPAGRGKRLHPPPGQGDGARRRVAYLAAGVAEKR